MSGSYAKLRAASLRYFPLAMSAINFGAIILGRYLLAGGECFGFCSLLQGAPDWFGHLFFPNSLFLFAYAAKAMFYLWASSLFVVVIVPLSVGVGFVIERLSRRLPAFIVLLAYVAGSVGVDMLTTRIAFSL